MFPHAANINNWAVGRDSELGPNNIRQRLCKTIRNYDSHPGVLDTLKCSVIRHLSHHRLTSTMLVYQRSFLAVGFYSCPSRNRIRCTVGVLSFISLSKCKVFSFLVLATSFWSEIGGRQCIRQARKWALVTTFRPGQGELKFLVTAMFCSLELKHLLGSRNIWKKMQNFSWINVPVSNGAVVNICDHLNIYTTNQR